MKSKAPKNSEDYMKEKNRIIESCDTIEKALETIKNAAIEREFNIEEWVSFNEIQGYTAAKYPQIRRYARRVIP